MKCAEQVRNVYVRVQMWKAVYCYIISTNVVTNALPMIPDRPPFSIGVPRILISSFLAVATYVSWDAA